MSQNQLLKSESKNIYEAIHQVEIEDLIFALNKDDNTAFVIGCRKRLKKINIPFSINYEMQNYTITAILDGAFKFFDLIKTINFPENSKIQTIGKESFLKSSIETISIPSHVTQIGECAFLNCKSLRTVIFSENSELLTISRGLFLKSSIESIVIPSSVTKICQYAFYYCDKLRQVEFSKNSKIELIEKFSFSASSIQSLSIPSSIVELQDGWCHEASHLFEIKTFENGKINVKNYGDEMMIGKSDTNEENFDILLFVSRNVKKTLIPSSIKKMSSYCFSRSSIQNITIPKSVTQICENSFFHCESLQKVEFEENSELHIIEKSAFSNSSIEFLSIPSSVVELKECWCYETPKLNEINVFYNEKVNIKKSNDDLLIGKTDINCKNFDVLLFASRNVEKTIIPSSIKIISSYSFSNSTIKSISIPKSVTQINEGAFYFCFQLQNVEIENDSNLQLIGKYAFAYSSIESLRITSKVTQIGENSFDYCENLQIIEFSSSSGLNLIDKSLFTTCSQVIIMIPCK